MTTHLRNLAVPALIAGMLIMPGCSSKSDDAKSATTTAASAAAPGGGRLQRYCDASLAIESAQPDLDFESATPQEITAGLKKFATEVLAPLFHDVDMSAPPELDAQVDRYRTVIGQLARSGDPAVFDTPEMKATEATTHAFDLANCRWQQAKVTATDYAFGGLASHYEPGPLSIDLTNDGKEVHELIVLKIRDGVTESAEDLVQMDEETGSGKVEWIGNVDPTTGGDRDYVVVDLEPGRYVVSCFLPVGATDMEHLHVDGPPHAAGGMVAELDVS
ncbi:MAG: hypothetical protein R2698_03325 [Microthrixaceae bacterium]